MTQSSSAHETAENCYALAYFILPQYVDGQAATFIDNLAHGPTVGAWFYYGVACGLKGRDPDPELLHSFPVHVGDLDEANCYCIIGYPTPPSVDLSELSLEEMFELGDKVILAPYFSAFVVNKHSNEARYYVLGQSPDGVTTLRGVTPTMNANLGPGCEPDLKEFIALLRGAGHL